MMAHRLLFLLLVLAFSARTSLSQPPDQSPAQPPVSLAALSGPPVSLKSLEGRVVVLAFGGTWTPLFARELASLQRLANRYEMREVSVFWISIDSDRPGTRNYASDQELQGFLKRSNLRLPVLRDPEMATYRSFDLAAVPTIVLLDQEGRVVRKYVGMGTEQGEVYAGIIAEIERLLH